MNTHSKSDGLATTADGNDAIGPRSEAERHLYELVLAGLDGGPLHEASVAEVAAQLRARALAARAKNEG